MKTSKFTKAQKAFILKQGKEGTPVSEIFRKGWVMNVKKNRNIYNRLGL